MSAAWPGDATADTLGSCFPACARTAGCAFRPMCLGSLAAPETERDPANCRNKEHPSGRWAAVPAWRGGVTTPGPNLAQQHILRARFTRPWANGPRGAGVEAEACPSRRRRAANGRPAAWSACIFATVPSVRRGVRPPRLWSWLLLASDGTRAGPTRSPNPEESGAHKRSPAPAAGPEGGGMLARSRLLAACCGSSPGPSSSLFAAPSSVLVAGQSRSRHFSQTRRSEDVDSIAAAASVVADAATWAGPVDVFASYLKFVHSSTGLPWCVDVSDRFPSDPAWLVSESASLGISCKN